MPDENPRTPVRELLLRDVDELTEAIGRSLEAVRAVTDQLEPDRARSCRNAINIAAIQIDEIKLRAHAAPMDQPERQTLEGEDR
jgi:hypothetical protein